LALRSFKEEAVIDLLFLLIAGDLVVFKVTATNTGNIELLTVAITDDRFPPVPFDSATAAAACGGSGVTLQPGERVECNVTYTITQPELNAGSFVHVANASGGLSSWVPGAAGCCSYQSNQVTATGYIPVPVLDLNFTNNISKLYAPGESGIA
jgi:hypothetical protein